MKKQPTSLFPCSGCGSCCRRVNKAVEGFSEYTKDKDHQLYFPYKWDETGKCENLTSDNKCLVYNNRPLICNIDKFIEVTSIDKKEFYKLNIIECNKIMDEDDIPKEFRIKQ